MFLPLPHSVWQTSSWSKSIYSDWMMELKHRIEFTLLHHTRQNNHFNDLNPVTSEVSAVQHTSLLWTTYCKFTLIKYWLTNWTQTTDENSAFSIVDATRSLNRIYSEVAGVCMCVYGQACFITRCCVWDHKYRQSWSQQTSRRPTAAKMLAMFAPDPKRRRDA